MDFDLSRLPSIAPYLINPVGSLLQNQTQAAINRYKKITGDKKQSQQKPTTQQQTKSTTPTRRNYGFNPESIQGMIVNEAYAQGVDPALALGIARHESGFNPNAMGDNGKSYGLFQIHSPSHPDYKGGTDVLSNIRYGIKLIKNLSNKYKGNTQKVIAAYNAGSGAVDRGRIPASTRNNYIPAVMQNINNYNNNIPQTNTNSPQSQTFNESPLEASGTDFNWSSLIVNPVNKETMINQPSNVALDIYKQKIADMNTNIPQINQGVTMSSNIPYNQIGAISAYNAGLGKNIQTPQIAPTDSELQAYMNALQAMGANVSNNQRAADELVKAYNRDRQQEALVNFANTIGNMFNRPADSGQYVSMVSGGLVNPNMGGNTNNVNVPMPTSSNYQEALLRQKATTDKTKTQVEQANQMAKLMTGINVSNATGLPLNVAMNMEPKDYINFINPIQEAQGDIYAQTSKDVGNIINTNLANQGKLNVQELQNAGNLTVAQANNLADLLQSGEEQANANYRAELDARTRANIASANNATDIAVANITGTNLRDVQMLRNQNPAAYYNLVSSAINASTYMNDPAFNQYIKDTLYGITGYNPSQGQGQTAPDGTNPSKAYDFINGLFR